MTPVLEEKRRLKGFFAGTRSMWWERFVKPSCSKQGKTFVQSIHVPSLFSQTGGPGGGAMMCIFDFWNYSSGFAHFATRRRLVKRAACTQRSSETKSNNNNNNILQHRLIL